MIYVFLIISCIVFSELFIFLNLKNEAMELVTRSREAMAVVMSSKLDDDAKETMTRQASIDIFKATFKFVLKFLLIVIVLYAMYWLFITIVPELRVEILESFVSPLVIIGLTVAAMSYVWVRNAVLK